MANDINLGAGAIDDLRIGADKADKVMFDGEQVWPNIPPSADFEGEFTMADTADHFKIGTWGVTGGAQYSSDKVNWNDVNVNADVTGSLKWYVRQKPGEPDLLAIDFAHCDILSCDKVETATVTTLSFRGCPKLTSVPMFDTSAFTWFGRMFFNCSSLTSIPVLDTSKGTTFEEMFGQCSALASVPAFDTSKGADFRHMFFSCSALTSIPTLNTSKGTGFNKMFRNCTGLTTIPALDVSKGDGFESMFEGCTELVHLPALSTGGGSGTLFHKMFENCAKLKCLTSIDTTQSWGGTDMFTGCTLLTAPSAAEQAQIAATPGIAWTNSGTCP